MMRPALVLLVVVSLAACAGGDSAPSGGDSLGDSWPFRRAAAAPAPDGGAAPAVAEARAALPPAPRTAAQFDTTTAAERAAAVAPPPAAERELGRVVASLGNPADPGIWLETPLVSAVTQGRVVWAGQGASVALELRPAGDASGTTRISLPALRLLGAPLTALPELIVYAR